MSSHWSVINAGINYPQTALDLWQAAINYFKWCDDNPLQSWETVRVGKEAGKRISVYAPRMYTLKALCLHCNMSLEYVKSIRNTEDKQNEYYIVISKILYIIYTQNVEMAAVNMLNPIFISKLLSIGEEENDDTPASIKIEHIKNLPEIAKSESDVLEKLDFENTFIKKSSI